MQPFRKKRRYRVKVGLFQHIAAFQRPPAAAPRDDKSLRMAEDQGNPGRPPQGKTICFDCSKREAYTPTAGLKTWRRKLQNSCALPAAGQQDILS